jgi:hypothetical protein
MEEIYKIVGKVIIEVGGIAGLIIIVSKHLAKIFADKYIERTKATFQKEIDEYQSKLEILKQTTLRYSDKQFEHYNKLWISLVELKSLGNELWNSATSQNLTNFSRQLKLTKIEIERSSIFMEEEHYQEIMDTLKSFSEFEFGKVRLIDYRESDLFDAYQVNQMINLNKSKKEKYEQLMTQIKFDLQRQLKA